MFKLLNVENIFFFDTFECLNDMMFVSTFRLIDVLWFQSLIVWIFSMFEWLNFRSFEVFEYFNVWMFRFFNCWIFERMKKLHVWMFECLKCLRDQMEEKLECLNVWNILMLEQKKCQNVLNCLSKLVVKCLNDPMFEMFEYFMNRCLNTCNFEFWNITTMEMVKSLNV